MHCPDLSIIIVNWNSADYVSACVESIRRETCAVRYEIIVVDNGSFDGCQERLATEHPTVRFIQNGENLGFAGANNLGAKAAAGDVLLFLNPDTEVLDGAIDRMYCCLATLPDAGVLGCRLLNTDRSTQFSSVFAFPTVLNQVLGADMLQRWTPKAGIWGARTLFEATEGPSEVEGISGACMMIRRGVFERVGGFSSTYFMYAEDVELCFVVKSAGFRNYHAGFARIIHHGGGSSNRRPSRFSVVMMRESVALFFRRSRGPLASAGYRAALTLAATCRLVLLLLAAPVWLATGGAKTWNAAIDKWLAILMWGVGLERPGSAR
jgi:GT2 family glycosyltransferase